MRRREFIALIGCGAAMWPLVAQAQQAGKVRHIGILDTTTRELNKDIGALFKGLQAFGYIEGQNLIVEYRSADGRNERLPDLVSELLRLNLDLIVVRGTPETIAIKNANSKIPVVMSAVVDPVGLGIVASLNHPGGNITGMSSTVTMLDAKRLEKRAPRSENDPGRTLDAPQHNQRFRTEDLIPRGHERNIWREPFRDGHE